MADSDRDEELDAQGLAHDFGLIERQRHTPADDHPRCQEIEPKLREATVQEAIEVLRRQRERQ